jgi:hypothetical protein
VLVPPACFEPLEALDLGAKVRFAVHHGLELALVVLGGGLSPPRTLAANSSRSFDHSLQLVARLFDHRCHVSYPPRPRQRRLLLP